MMKLKPENLAQIGFLKSGDHESVKNLFYKDLFTGLEIEVDCSNGDGKLSFFNPEKDLAVALLKLHFSSENQLMKFIEVIADVRFFTF